LHPGPIPLGARYLAARMRALLQLSPAARRRVAIEVLIGAAFAATGLGMRLLIDPAVGTRQPFLLSLCAVILAAYWRGTFAATTALIIGLPLCTLLFVEPRGTLVVSGTAELLNLLFSIMMGLLIVGVTRQRGHARRRAANAERDLRDQEELLKVATAAARLGVWSWDVATGTIYRSPELERIVGLEPGSVDRSREPMATRAIDEDRARVHAALAEAVRTGNEFEVEGRFLRADGVVRWMYSRGRPLVGPSGKVERVVGVGLDITERKAAEESLRRSDERFRLALSTNAVIVYEQDEQLRYRWVYPDNSDQHRRSIGKTDLELVGEPHGTRLYELKQRVLQTGVPERHEIEVPLEAGVFHYDLIIEPRRGADGKPNGVIGVATDITARRVAEAAEKANQQRLDLALSAAHMGIWSWDSRRQRLEWSKEMFTLHQAAPGVTSLSGEELRAFAESLVHKDDLPRLKATIARKLERNEDFDLEYRVTLNGEERWMCTRGQKIDLGHGQFQVLGVVMDITHRKQVDEELARYRRELENLLAQRTLALQELKASQQQPPQAPRPVRAS